MRQFWKDNKQDIIVFVGSISLVVFIVFILSILNWAFWSDKLIDEILVLTFTGTGLSLWLVFYCILNEAELNFKEYMQIDVGFEIASRNFWKRRVFIDHWLKIGHDKDILIQILQNDINKHKEHMYVDLTNNNDKTIIITITTVNGISRKHKIKWNKIETIWK